MDVALSSGQALMLGVAGIGGLIGLPLVLSRYGNERVGIVFLGTACVFAVFARFA